MENNAFGRRVAILRKQRGLTQKEFAEKMGVAPILITDYERGKLRLFDEIIVKMAEALETTTDDLLGYKADQKPIEANLRIMKRVNQIAKLSEFKQKTILRMIDGYIKGESNSNRGSNE